MIELANTLLIALAALVAAKSMHVMMMRMPKDAPVRAVARERSRKIHTR